MFPYPIHQILAYEHIHELRAVARRHELAATARMARTGRSDLTSPTGPFSHLKDAVARLLLVHLRARPVRAEASAAAKTSPSPAAGPMGCVA